MGATVVCLRGDWSASFLTAARGPPAWGGRAARRRRGCPAGSRPGGRRGGRRADRRRRAWTWAWDLSKGLMKGLTPAQSAQLGTTEAERARGELGAWAAAFLLKRKSLWVGSCGFTKGLKLGSTGRES